MRVAILGFGLIGGSIARALAEAPDRPAWSVAAWSPTGDGPGRAAADGVIETAADSPAEAIDGAQLVVLAAPPTATIELVGRLGTGLRPALAPDTVITDVASTKAAVVAAATEHGLRFVGGHPMAGRETSGYQAASADLFVDRPWVVVPTDPDDLPAVVAVETLAVACRARPIRHGCRDPRSGRCRDQPPAAGRRGGARRDGRRARRGRAHRRRAGRWHGPSPLPAGAT